MMEVRNSGVESQSLDRSQQIQKIDGDGAKLVGAPVGVVAGGGVKAEVGNAGGGDQVVKKKRGRPPRVQANPPAAKKSKEEDEDEDVCFICFDGGSLVLCDRRGCPKAYHPACIKRDEAFFRSKAKWNCGWHICSICEKTSHHMCYTCTYSLCKGCIKKSDYVCVRGDKGFCTICMKTIMLIENSGQGKDETARVDFDDKTSWEYLFKVYWVYLKDKLSLTFDELTQAKNPWKQPATISPVSPSTGLHIRPNGLRSITSDLEANESKRRKTNEDTNGSDKETINTEKVGPEENLSCKEWASKELLDFVSHMKNGDTSMLSQFDVQALLLEYIKRNNLRKKNQIECDLRLKNLFGKPRVGHIEMLKLLEFHFLGEKKQGEADSNFDNNNKNDSNNNHNNIPVVGKERERRSQRKGEKCVPQNKLDEYAAIDVHNMNLIYLRRNLVENLIEDREKFHEKVVGSIVQIGISGSDQKHDMYRLVQVVGTTKVDVLYKIGDKLVDIMLEVLNLDKKEAVPIDTISNQELSEDDCRRLRESVRCGLVRCFTVGEIQEKAMALRSVLLDDRMEAEMTRLNQFRDRASEKGQKKGVRECVQKLKLLKRPEERERRLREIPEVHSDPKMNPDYESDDTEEYFNNEHGEHLKPKYPWVSGPNTISPQKRAENLTDQPKNLTVPTDPTPEEGSSNAKSNAQKDTIGSSSLSRPQNEPDCDGSTIAKRAMDDVVWHYRDPSGNIQGPFSMAQLQKWNLGRYFPTDMKIWANREDDSVLLNNLLQQQFHNYDLQSSKNVIADNKIGNQVEGVDVCSPISSPTIPVMPYGPNPVKLEKLPDGHGSLGQPSSQNWNRDPPSVADEPAKQFDARPISPVFTGHEDDKLRNAPSKLVVQDSANPPSWNTALSLVVGGAQIPEPANEWVGYGTGTVKREPWDSGPGPGPDRGPDPLIPPTTTIDPTWHGLGETIEFSTLAEESVSDLLAEVDAMESRNGVPSPTSRRNSFLEDLFNGSIDEFSPVADQAGPRSDGFSSSPADIQLHMAAGNNVFDLVKRSTGLQFPFAPQTTSSENIGFKWGRDGPAEIPTTRQDMIDLNDSTKAEPDDVERESRVSVDRDPDPGLTLADGQPSKLVVEEEEEGEFIQQEIAPPPPPLPLPPPPPPPPLTIGFDPVDSRRVISETTHKNPVKPSSTGRSGASRSGNTVRDREPHHRRSGSDRYSNNNSPRERAPAHHVDESGHSRSSRASWGRQSSFGSGGSSGGGGYSRPSSKGQRVCKFYESGRCKKGSACNYLHP